MMPCNLQVMHCVMFPRKQFDVPILSFDMVGKNGRISLVCIDACPVAMDRSLPLIYKTVLEYAPSGLLRLKVALLSVEMLCPVHFGLSQQ